MVIITVVALLAEGLLTFARDGGSSAGAGPSRPRTLTARGTPSDPAVHPVRRSQGRDPHAQDRQHPALAAAGALALTTLTACADDAACRADSGATATAGGAGRPQVKIMVGGIDKVIYLPAMLTERLGYFKERGPQRQAPDRAGRRPGGERPGLRRRPGRRRLLRPHARPADQGQVRRVASSSSPHVPGEVEVVVQQGGRRHHLPRGLQGQEARRHRPRLLDRLPHQVPRGPATA